MVQTLATGVGSTRESDQSFLAFKGEGPMAETATAPAGPRIVKPDPDPTDRTIQVLDASLDAIKDELEMRAEIRQREHASLQELLETRMANNEELALERVASIRREIAINEAHRIELKSDSETHRLELKSDGEKTLTTATIAAEKAVQAALAAAEKARDQQTIASQLATTKAEETSKEQLKQQGETFTTGIAGLTTGFNDVKTQLSELRAERRGNQEQVIVARDNAADMKPIVDAIAALMASQQQTVGKGTQNADNRSINTLAISAAGAFMFLMQLGLGLFTLLKKP